MLYTDRPGFLEHPCLVKALQESVNCEEVTMEEVEKMSDSLFEKASKIVPNTKTSPIGFDGAQIAAKEILKWR